MVVFVFVPDGSCGTFKEGETASCYKAGRWAEGGRLVTEKRVLYFAMCTTNGTLSDSGYLD